jgi:hypothetical protein
MQVYKAQSGDQVDINILANFYSQDKADASAYFVSVDEEQSKIGCRLPWTRRR